MFGLKTERVKMRGSSRLSATYTKKTNNNNNNKENKRINGTSAARFKVKRWYPSLIFISLREALASEKKLAS